MASKVSVGRVGEMTRLSLRPERVIINPAQGGVANVFSGRVEELIYLGDHIRTRVSVCGNDDFIVKVPNSQRHQIAARGQEIKLGWSAADCHALDAIH